MDQLREKSRRVIPFNHRVKAAPAGRHLLVGAKHYSTGHHVAHATLTAPDQYQQCFTFNPFNITAGLRTSYTEAT